MHVDRRNRCTGELLIFGGGVGEDVDVEFGPRLSTAQLHGIVPVSDIVSGQTVQVTVDVVWSGVGPLEHATDHSHYDDDGLLVKSHSNDWFRLGAAVGHVVEETSELVAEGSPGNGFLDWSNYGQVLIDRTP